MRFAVDYRNQYRLGSGIHRLQCQIGPRLSLSSCFDRAHLRTEVSADGLRALFETRNRYRAFSI